MKIVEIAGEDYKLPESWSEVTVETYEKIQAHSSFLSEYKSQLEFVIELFGILLGIDALILKSMTKESFEILTKEIEWLNDDIPLKRQESFEIDGEKFVPVKDLKKLTTGDMISIEVLIADSNQNELLGNLLPILIRRAKKVSKKSGKVKYVPAKFDADEYEDLKELFKKNLSIEDVLYLKDFFFDGEKQSSIITKAISEKEKLEKKVKKKV